MPELPEVEVIVQGLQKKITGRKIIDVKINLPKLIALGKKSFVKKLKGLIIKNVHRRGKYIIIDLSKQQALLIHLKMTGQLIIAKATDPLNPHAHFILTLSNALELRFHDTRQFGRIYLLDSRNVCNLKQLNMLGPEANRVSKQEFLKRLSKRKGRIKPLLLNQSFLAGLGNIYCDESLYSAGIHPLCLAYKISRGKQIKLHQAIQRILNSAIAHGGSSVENYLDSQGKPGRYQKKHKVYRKTGRPCSVCRNPIQRIKIGGRSTHFCSFCQKNAPLVFKRRKLPPSDLQ